MESIQIFANGLVSGVAIGLMALAFTVVYLPTRVFHVSLAGGYAAAPFVALALSHARWPLSIAFVAGVLTTATLSLVTEMMIHRRLDARAAPPAVQMMASLGVYMVLVQLLALTWGTDAKVLRMGRDGVVALGRVSLSVGQLTIALGGALTLASFFAWLHRSRGGLEFRALADNPGALALMGYNTDRLRLIAFTISGTMAGVSALLVASDTGFAAYGGFPALLFGVVATVLGGQRSFMGPLLAGLLLGIIRTGTGWVISTRWQDVVVFALLAAFLMLRPEGIIAKRLRADTVG